MRCASSSCKALAIAAACSVATFVSASASSAWAFAAFAWALTAFACDSRMPWSLTPPGAEMRAAFLMSPMMTFP